MLKFGCQTVGDVAKGVVNGDVIGIPGDVAGNVIGGTTTAIGESIAEALTRWVADGAVFMLDKVGGLIDGTTTPQLDAEWFASNYRAMAALAAVLLVPLLLMSVIGAVVHQDAGRLLRSVFGYLPMAALLTAAGVALVSIGLVVTDEMSVWVAQGAGDDAGTFLARSGTALYALTGTGGLFATFVGGLLLVIGTVVVWFELLLRSAAIYIAVLFLPLALAGLVWPATAHWAKRLAHLLAAVVLSKFVIAAILALAASGLAATGGEGGFGAVLAGGALLGLAALSPLALLKLVPVIEAGAGSMAAAGRNPTPAHAVHGGGLHMYQQAQRWKSRNDTAPPLRTWNQRAAGAGPAGGAASGGRSPAGSPGGARAAAATGTVTTGNAGTAAVSPGRHEPNPTSNPRRPPSPPSSFTADSAPPPPARTPDTNAEPHRRPPHPNGDNRDQRP